MITLTDGTGVYYRFERHPIASQVYGVNVVYGFAVGTSELLYLGKAHILSERLAEHEKIQLSKLFGASELLVHRPTAIDPIPYDVAETRLIRWYSPLLNQQHSRMPANGREQIIGFRYAEALRRPAPSA